MQKPSFPQSSSVPHIPDSGFLHCCGGFGVGLNLQTHVPGASQLNIQHTYKINS